MRLGRRNQMFASKRDRSRSSIRRGLERWNGFVRFFSILSRWSLKHPCGACCTAGEEMQQLHATPTKSAWLFSTVSNHYFTVTHPTLHYPFTRHHHAYLVKSLVVTIRRQRGQRAPHEVPHREGCLLLCGPRASRGGSLKILRQRRGLTRLHARRGLSRSRALTEMLQSPLREVLHLR